MKKYMNMIEKCFLVQKMDECRNIMLHQILSDRHVGSLSNSKKEKAEISVKNFQFGYFIFYIQNNHNKDLDITLLTSVGGVPFALHKSRSL